MVCSCFVVAWRNVLPRTSAVSSITLEMKTEPLSVIITVGKYACFVTMSMIILAVLAAVGLDSGYAKAYFENTSIAVTMFS